MSKRPKVHLIVACVLALAALHLARAQDQHKNKVLSKITSGGPTHQAFNGQVQSLDLDNSVLSVKAVEGSNIEIFPIRKGIRVSAAEGGKLKLEGLTPGTNVLVYYEQKGDRRTVKQIVVLASAPAGKKTESPPPS